MGIRAAVKEDLKATAAEMVYGEPIRLPDEFLQEVPSEKQDNSDFIRTLRKAMQNLRPQQVQRPRSAVVTHQSLNTKRWKIQRMSLSDETCLPPHYNHLTKDRMKSWDEHQKYIK